MRMSSLVLPLVLFTGIMVGFQSFGLNMMNEAGVDAEGFSTVETQQDQLEDKWVEEGSQQSTWREEEGVLEQAVGVVLIPRIATDMVSVGQNMMTILDEVGESRWVPSWATSTIKTLITASVFFALSGAYLRYRV
jgi:magnesium-transporting ATPase (P-type)